MVKISFNLNEPKDSSKTGRTPKSLTLEIHHGGCFTPIPSRSYIGGQVSSVNVVDIDEFCLHDLKDMVVKLGYGVADLMYYHFLIPRLGLDYGLHPLNVDADVLEWQSMFKDYKIILVYVEHGNSNVDTSIFVTPKKRVAIAVDNHLRNAPIEIDSGPDVNRNLTPMCHKNLKKEWEQSANDPFEDLDEILGDYANTGKHITGDEITGKQMVVYVGNSSTVDNVLDLEMIFETEGVGPIEKFKEVEDSDYDPKHDEVFDDGEHIVEDVHVSMNNFSFTADPKHDLSIGGVEVQEDDLDVIDYDSFCSDLDDVIDSGRRIQLRELRRIGMQKNKGPNKYYFYLGQQFATKERVTGRVRMHSVETRRKLIMVKNDKEMVRVRCEGIIPALRVRVRSEGTIPALVPYVATDIDMGKNKFSQTKDGLVIRESSISGKQNILGKDKTIQRKGKKVNKPKKNINTHALGQCLLHTLMKAAGRFLLDHIIKSLATNPDIPVRAVQDQMQKQFDVGVSKMKAFRIKRIITDKMTGSFREQFSLIREYAQELIKQNPSTTVRIDVQQEPNPESLTRTFKRVYVCLGALKQGFRACGREILGLDGCFMLGPCPG
ncbi:hypothetical protein Tco_1277463 [Tanacetum coccineum]